MGTSKSSKKIAVAGALFSGVQERVLALLFGQPDRRFQGVEVLELARGGTGAVHRQLTRLEAAGLLAVTRVGNQKFYQANRASPVFDELHGLIAKTVGLVGPLAKALAPLRDRIPVAWTYTSAPDLPEDDRELDVIAISDTLTHGELTEALRKAERVGPMVNPILLTRAIWDYRRNLTDAFSTRINAPGKLFIIGGDDALG